MANKSPPINIEPGSNFYQIKTAFIPYGTNAVCIRGATQVRLAFHKKTVGDATGASLTLFKHDHLVYALAL